VIHALHDRVQGNWPSFLFPALAIAAVAATRRDWKGRIKGVVRVSERLAVPVAALLVFLAYAQALFGIVPLGRTDPLSRLLAVGFTDVARQVDGERARTGAKAILTTDYASTAWLAFYLPSGAPVIPVTETARWQFAPPANPDLLTGTLLYVAEKRQDRSDAVRKGYRDVTSVAQAYRMRRGKIVAEYVIYRVAGPKAVPEGRLP
jgi:hypothetical protein